MFGLRSSPSTLVVPCTLRGAVAAEAGIGFTPLHLMAPRPKRAVMPIMYYDVGVTPAAHGGAAGNTSNNNHQHGQASSDYAGVFEAGCDPAQVRASLSHRGSRFVGTSTSTPTPSAPQPTRPTTMNTATINTINTHQWAAAHSSSNMRVTPIDNNNSRSSSSNCINKSMNGNITSNIKNKTNVVGINNQNSEQEKKQGKNNQIRPAEATRAGQGRTSRAGRDGDADEVDTDTNDDENDEDDADCLFEMDGEKEEEGHYDHHPPAHFFYSRGEGRGGADHEEKSTSNNSSYTRRSRKVSPALFQSENGRGMNGGTRVPTYGPRSALAGATVTSTSPTTGGREEEKSRRSALSSIFPSAPTPTINSINTINTNNSVRPAAGGSSSSSNTTINIHTTINNTSATTATTKTVYNNNNNIKRAPAAGGGHLRAPRVIAPPGRRCIGEGMYRLRLSSSC